MKRSPASASATQKELETSIAKWLTGARDRDGLRVNRQKSRSADPVAEEFVAVPTGTSSSLSPVLPMLGDNELELDEPNYE